MHSFVRIAIVIVSLFGVVSPTIAKSSWHMINRPSLEVRPSGEEVDASMRASCIFSGLILLRIGAENHLGEGKGEGVSVTIESGGKSAKLRGISRFSPESEMTGGRELVTEVPLNDPVLEILFSGKLVTMITQDQKKHQLLDVDNGGVGKKFLKQCAGA